MSAAGRPIDIRARVAPSIWPTPAQLELLRAALWGGDEARAAWTRWRALEDVGVLDFSSWQLLPLAWRNLHGLGMTDEVLEQGRGFHRYHWARNQQLLRQAAVAVRAWQARGVPVVVLKGAALAAGVYPDPGLRPMADVDLLVPPERAGEVADWLQADGWQPQESYPQWADVSLETLQSFNWQRGTERLDLHWHVLHRCTRPEVTRLFWERARPLALAGADALQLAPEDAFLHVCSHGVQYSSQAPFRWLADAAWILRRAGAGAFDWTRVVDLAERTGTSLPLRHGLDYAVAELRLPVPAPVLAALRARRAAWRERWEYRRTTEPAAGNRAIRAWNLAGLLWRVGGTGAPWTRARRMRRFLCARWESPDLRTVLVLALRKMLTGHRGTMKVGVPAMKA
jgi:hypothetical protein